MKRKAADEAVGIYDKNYPASVRLTLKLLRAMGTALAYATAGGPADIGLDESDPKSHDELAEIARAPVWVGQEMERRRKRAKEKRS